MKKTLLSTLRALAPVLVFILIAPLTAWAAGRMSGRPVTDPLALNVLRINSGTTFTIQDAAGNAGPVFTDDGSEISLRLDGDFTVDSSTTLTGDATLNGGVGALRFGTGETITANDATLDVTGALMVSGGSDSIVKLIVQGVLGQVALLFVVENSAGADQFTVSNAGAVVALGTGTWTGDMTLNGGTGAATVNGQLIVDGTADEIQLRVQSFSTQTTLPFVVENSAGTDQFTVSNAGAVVLLGSLSFTDANVLIAEAGTNDLEVTADGGTSWRFDSNGFGIATNRLLLFSLVSGNVSMGYTGTDALDITVDAVASAFILRQVASGSEIQFDADTDETLNVNAASGPSWNTGTGNAYIWNVNAVEAARLNATSLSLVAPIAFSSVGVVASGGAVNGIEIDYTAADVTATDTTPVSVTGISFAVEANDSYAVHCEGRVFTALATAGPQMGLDLPASSTTTAVCSQTTAATTYGTDSFTTDDGACANTVGGLVTPGGNFQLNATVNVSGTAGNVLLRVRSETTDDVTVAAGTMCSAKKILDI
mgnify:FL=1